ncbi:hypothetical protein DPMN_120916 [Dreissena polymorpha]|uniref:Uncharacterized protein n=1 Tax=Dreissena polymorpha TaxID=45954 RepID=A0A9D4JSL9_DREPO|nr:hypothetical protein DPMN_120916 [Dreissena polymorpha]
MQRLDLGSKGNQYMDDINIGPSGDLSFPSMGAGTHGMPIPSRGRQLWGHDRTAVVRYGSVDNPGPMPVR